MHPTTGFAVIAFLLAPVAAAGRDADVQFWSTLNTLVPLSETVQAGLELSHRARSDRAGGDQLQLRGTATVSVLPGVDLGGGAVFADNRKGNEFRPFQQVSFTHGPVILRTMLEQRMIGSQPRTGLRLRERVQVKVRLDERLQASASTELSYVLRATTTGGRTGFDQFRAVVIAQRRIGREVDLGLGYTMILGLRGPSPKRISHAPQLTVYWRP